MKKLFKLITLILTSAITLSFSGCADYVVENLTNDYIPEEDCHILSGIDASIYTYSDKLEVHMSSDYTDKLSIKCGTENISDWYTILSGDFTKAAWYDYKHVVLLNGTYYEFDIREYKVPKTIDEELVYELKEYTQGEFLKAYPEYESFNWYQM